jgi:hypothetical protein
MEFSSIAKWIFPVQQIIISAPLNLGLFVGQIRKRNTAG